MLHLWLQKQYDSENTVLFTITDYFSFISAACIQERQRREIGPCCNQGHGRKSECCLDATEHRRRQNSFKRCMTGLFSQTGQGRDRTRAGQRPTTTINTPLAKFGKGKGSKSKPEWKTWWLPIQKRPNPSRNTSLESATTQGVEDDYVEDAQDAVIYSKRIQVNSSIRSGGKRTADVSVSFEQAKITTNTSINSEQGNLHVY